MLTQVSRRLAGKGTISEVTFPTVAKSLTALSPAPTLTVQTPGLPCFELGASETALLALLAQVLQATVPTPEGRLALLAGHQPQVLSHNQGGKAFHFILLGVGHVNMSTHVCVCTSRHVCICVCVHANVHVYVDMYAFLSMCVYVCTCSLDCCWPSFPLQPCPLKLSFETEASRANPCTGPCSSPSSALLEASWLQQTRLPHSGASWPYCACECRGGLRPPAP